MKSLKTRSKLLILLTGFILFSSCTTAQVNSGNVKWHAVLIAGSYLDDERKISNWDNAVREMADLLLVAGLKREDMRLLSSNPDKIGESYHGILQEPAWQQRIKESLTDLELHNGDGLILYITSHGFDDKGIFLESEEDFRNILSPADLNTILKESENIPVLVFLSACFSGDFISGDENIKGDNRLILTSAAKDRSSFGCKGGYIMPEWDDSLLTVLGSPEGLESWYEVFDKLSEEIKEKEVNFPGHKKSQPQASFPINYSAAFTSLLKQIHSVERKTKP